MSFPRRRVVELIARYELEPTLRDVFVEGEFDSEVIARVLSESSWHDDSISVYPIDTVDVDISFLQKHGLTLGNKQRVLALARELHSVCKLDGYRCIVVRDLDHWFGDLDLTTRGLRWTDYCSLELYFYASKTVADILQLTCKCRISDWDSFYDSFGRTLNQLYALRLADRDLCLGVEWIAFTKCLSSTASVVRFDIDEYGKRLLNSNGKSSELPRWKVSVDGWLQRIGTADRRLAIRGHDFIDLLAWSVREFRGQNGFDDAARLQRLLVLIAERIVAPVRGLLS